MRCLGRATCTVHLLAKNVEKQNFSKMLRSLWFVFCFSMHKKLSKSCYVDKKVSPEKSLKKLLSKKFLCSQVCRISNYADYGSEIYSLNFQKISSLQLFIQILPKYTVRPLSSNSEVIHRISTENRQPF